MRDETIYFSDQGEVNIRALFCHTSRIDRDDAEESQSEEEDCTVKCIHKVVVHNLSLISQENVSDLASPYAMCASAKDEFEVFVSDVCLGKIFSIPNVVEEDYTREL